MTREEATQYIKRSYAIDGDSDDGRYHNEVMDYLLSVLTDIEKIKEEIIKYTDYDEGCAYTYDHFHYGVKCCLDIIDKYIGEGSKE